MKGKPRPKFIFLALKVGWLAAFLLLLGSLNVRMAVNRVVAQNTDQKVFLPIILNNYPLPLVNGNFEAGHTAWTEFSGKGLMLIFEAASMAAPPHGGNWAAWLGGADGEFAELSQPFTVLTNLPYLVYWEYLESTELVCFFDTGQVLVDLIPVSLVDFCQSNNTAGWVQRSLNLSAFAGRTVTLKFEMVTDSNFISNWFLDDLSLQPSPAP